MLYITDRQALFAIHCQVLLGVVNLIKEVANCKSFVPPKVYCCLVAACLNFRNFLFIQQTMIFCVFTELYSLI